jgi:hypothetical protein
MKTINDMIVGSTDYGQPEATFIEELKMNGTYSGECIRMLMREAGREWIKHFMIRFNISEEELPTQVHLRDLDDLNRKPTVYTYGLTDTSKILTWIMKETPKADLDTKLPGLSVIAWIKFFFNIKDGEENDGSRKKGK